MAGPVSSNYGTMQHQIADELGDRQDLLSPLSDSTLSLSPIQNAIQAAIAKWERENFYFNELYDSTTLSTVAQQEFYTSSDAAIIASMAKMDKVHILVSGNRYFLNPRTWQYLEDISINPTVYGMPVDYAYFAQQLRLYPIPDIAYALTFSGTKRFTALSANSDANPWTQDAEALIRSEAKLILAREVLFDDALEAKMMKAIYGDPAIPGDRGYLYALKAETTRRNSSAPIRPTYF